MDFYSVAEVYLLLGSPSVGASCILSMLVYVTFTPKKNTSQPESLNPRKFLSSNPVTRKIRTVVSRLASCRSMSKMDGTEVIDASDLFLCTINPVNLINSQHSVPICTDNSSMYPYESPCTSVTMWWPMGFQPLYR